MYGIDDPGDMALEARFREVAAMLAKGLLRLATRAEILRHVASETAAKDGPAEAGSGRDQALPFVGK